MTTICGGFILIALTILAAFHHRDKLKSPIGSALWTCLTVCEIAAYILLLFSESIPSVVLWMALGVFALIAVLIVVTRAGAEEQDERP